MKDFLQKINFCSLFLTFLLIVFWGGNFSLLAQTRQDLVFGTGELVIASETSQFYTETESSFTLILPNISPHQVSVGTPSLPEGVSFLSSHKDLWVEGASSGTSIRLLFTFFRSGLVEIPPLDIMVDGSLYQVPFSPVEVFQNPRSLKPQVSLSFQNQQGQILVLQEDGRLVTTVGEPVLVTVSVGYGLALNKFHWDLVPNAIFQQVANFQDNFGATEVSHQFQPVAQFNLTPLEVGSLELPSMELEVQGYDQKVYRLFTGTVPIVSQVATVEKSSFLKTEISVQAQQAFASAFTALPVLPEENQQDSISVSHQDAQKLAQLRWQERKSFPWSKVFQQRRELEERLGIKSSKGEKSWFWGWFFFSIGFIMVGITIFGIVKKRLFLSVILGFFGILVLVWGIMYTHPLLKPAGILASQSLSKIPEIDAANLFPVEPYSLLEIKKEVLGWYYVSANGLEGWTPIEQVVLIAESPIGARGN